MVASDDAPSLPPSWPSDGSTLLVDLVDVAPPADLRVEAPVEDVAPPAAVPDVVATMAAEAVLEQAIVAMEPGGGPPPPPPPGPVPPPPAAPVRHAATISWGSFLMTYLPETDLQLSGWQCTCKFHKKSKNTLCKKTLRCRVSSEETPTQMLLMLKWWALQATVQSYQRMHLYEEPRGATLPPEAVMDADPRLHIAVPDVLLTDQEQDGGVTIEQKRAQLELAAEAMARAAREADDDADAGAGRGCGRARGKGRGRGSGRRGGGIAARGAGRGEAAAAAAGPAERPSSYESSSHSSSSSSSPDCAVEA